jgi:hypothetical protein
MAVSSIFISNLALSNLGLSSSIQSFDEKSAEAKACQLWYSPSLEMALEAYDWSFARRRKALALSDEDPPPDWAFRYIYPANCVKLRKLEQTSRQNDAYPYTIEMSDEGDRTILTNLDEAVAIFTFRQNVTSTYTPHFVQFLAYLMASNMAIKLTSKLKLKSDNLGLAGQALRTASALDAGEAVEEAPRESEIIRGRI